MSGQRTIAALMLLETVTSAVARGAHVHRAGRRMTTLAHRSRACDHRPFHWAALVEMLEDVSAGTNAQFRTGLWWEGCLYVQGTPPITRSRAPVLSSAVGEKRSNH
jgi:hypothetical protein